MGPSTVKGKERRRESSVVQSRGPAERDKRRRDVGRGDGGRIGGEVQRLVRWESRAGGLMVTGAG